MNKINIPFRGMTNVPDDSYSQDGSMSVLLNMRHKGGELVQCQPPAVRPLTAKIEQALYHAQSGLWLELTGGALTVQGKEEPIKESGVKSFAIMGNIVVIHLEKSVEYAIWRNGGYVYLGPLPEVPRLTIGIERVRKSVKTPYKYYARIKDAQEGGHEELFNSYVKKGYLDQCLDQLYKESAFIDRAEFRIALKLFDGSYICYSPIYYANALNSMDSEIGAQGGEFNYIWSAAETGTYIPWNASVAGFIPEYKLEDYNFEEWENIVLSVCLFTTGSIPLHKVVKTSLSSRDSGTIMSREYEDYVLKDQEERLKDMTHNQIFYKIAEYDLSGKRLNFVEDTSPSNLSVQDVLPDYSNPKETKYRHSYIYNSRMHISDITHLLHKGFTDVSFFNRSDSKKEIKKIAVITYLKTDEGEKKVVNIAENYNLTPSSGISALITYPDTRAYKTDIFILGKVGTRTVDGITEILYSLYYKSFKMQKHDTLNMAYHIKDTYSAEEGGVVTDSYSYSEFEKVKISPFEGVEVTFDTETGYAIDFFIEEERGTESCSNVLKVSAVDNPFYFPTARTYKFAGSIKGVATNAEAISTGQFGQYPLFVFTTEGIWAMQVDASGQGAYVSQSPFSREVCSGAVCPVSGGIVFTTARGVMVISGGQVMELSAPLDGLENLMLQGNLMTAIFGKAGKGLIPPVQIREYLKPVEGYETKLAYNYLHNEVILSNAKRGYSYVYSLTNQEWSIIDKVFDVITNSYPELVVYNNIEKKIYEFTEGNDPVPIVAITRPVKVDTLDFKRLRQAALRCTFEGSLNFYVLGSNDGASFVCITGKEHKEVKDENGKVKTQRDLITSMSRSKQYKYIAIAVAGNMKGRISLAEMLVEGGFASNQLR